MKNIILLSLLLTSKILVSAQDFNKDLSTLVNYNFLGGKNGLSNLTPEVFYGWRHISTDKKLNFKVGPYVASQIAVNDSSTFIPALMLPGNAGIILNSWYVFKPESNHKFMISANGGLKMMAKFADSTKTLLQHNVRFGAGYEFKELFNLTAQFTLGWHNLTSQSKGNYQDVFKQRTGDFRYWTVTLQTKISKEDAEKDDATYLILTWRSLVNDKDFPSLPNDKILSFGIRKDIGFDKALPAIPSALH